LTEIVGNAGAPAVEVIPIGGLGEFGMNMLLVASGDTAVIIDAGVMFPEPELYGVDLVIPDLSVLDAWRGRIRALILTHGHEDHIGAVAHVIARVDGPVYGTRFTLALVEHKLKQHGAGAGHELVTLAAGASVQVGAFRIEFIRVTHSIPDCVAVALHTPAGTIVHTGDFKIDQTPLDAEPTDLHKLAELGRNGVLALFSDSTNADRRGVTGSERDVVDGLEDVLSSTQGKLIVTAFSTSVFRMQVLVNLADQFSRRVAFVGRGMQHISQVASTLGVLRMPVGIQIKESQIRDFPPEDVMCLCTGSQGEPLAALPRIAINDHRHVQIGPRDVVAFSARVIPGNEKAIARVMNHVARRGADIVAEGDKHIHVSGHASAEELKLVISLIKPQHFVPIHGEYRQLARHARMATLVCPGTRVIMATDGDVIRFDAEGGRITGRVETGRVLIDGTRTGEVADEVLRDRRHLAGDGVVVAVVAIDGQTGALVQPPEVIGRGLSVDARHDDVLSEAPAMLARALEDAGLEERKDPGLLKERVRSEMQRLFKKRVGRRPLVVPVVMDV
jgi:ribonuclease J